MWIVGMVLAVLFAVLFGFVLGKLYVIEHDLPAVTQRLISETAKQLKQGEVYCFTLSREPDDDGGDDGDDYDDPLVPTEKQNWQLQ